MKRISKAGWVRISLVVALVAVVAVSIPLIRRATDDEPADQATAGWTLTWRDEFDGPAGSAPDEDRWGHDLGGGGWGNKESQYYTDSVRNAALDGDGKLVVSARADDAGELDCWYGACRYTSARLVTTDTFTQTYGRFEIRAKLPRGQGVWPAFWMLGANMDDIGWPASGEIDVMENVGNEPAVNHGSLHGPGYSDDLSITDNYTLPDDAAFADDFHTFRVDWEPNKITWYVDGEAYQTRTPADLNGKRWAFDHPFYLLLNVAVGGTWPGDPDPSTKFPLNLTVDYVRVYKS